MYILLDRNYSIATASRIGRLGKNLLLFSIFPALFSLTHGAEAFLRSRQLCSHSSTSQHFMEPEGSLPCSQETSTGLYPEPDQSNPYPSHPLSLRSILILFTHLRLGLPSVLLPSGFPTNNLYAFLFSPILATYPAHLTHLDLIILITLSFA
jgi:hypothetical protein